MVKVIIDSKFEKKFSKLKNQAIKNKIIKQMIKIKSNPKIGKPMKHKRKNTRELYISPYRISYAIKKPNLIYVLDFYHKDKQ